MPVACDIVAPAELDPFEVQKLEKELLTLDAKFMDVTETLAGGLYTRSAQVKRGEILIGATHKAKNYFHIATGKIAIWDKTHGLRVITAPFSEICQDGTQRIGIALTPVTCLNIFESDHQTTAEAEAAMIHPFTLPQNCATTLLQMARALLGQRGKIQLKI